MQATDFEVTEGFQSWVGISDGKRAEIKRVLQGRIGEHEIYITCIEVGWTERYENSWGESCDRLETELKSFEGVCDDVLLSTEDARSLWHRYLPIARGNMDKREKERNHRKYLFEKANKERAAEEQGVVNEVRKEADKKSRETIANLI